MYQMHDIKQKAKQQLQNLDTANEATHGTEMISIILLKL